MNYNEMAYKEIFRRITYASWATQHCIKWPRRVPGKRNAVFPFLYEFESWNKTCEISFIIFHSYRQNSKRTPMTTNNSSLHMESPRSLERVLNLGDHDRSWTSHKCFNIIIFHGYRQNPKRTPLMTNKSALHKVARLLEIEPHLGGREPSLTSESLEMVSKQLYRIQAVFWLAPIVLVLLIKVLTLGLV